MMIFLILINIALFFTLVKYLIDIQSYAIRLVKVSKLVQEPNVKDRKFMLVKGLY